MKFFNLEKNSRCFLLVLSVCWIRCNDSYNIASDYIQRKVENSSSYNSLIRPVIDSNEVLTVYMGFKLSQIISVDDKRELLTTRLWLEFEWKDSYLTWDPKNFDEIKSIHLPYKFIWFPDIVLFDDAEGKNEFQAESLTKIWHDGSVKLVVPGVFKSVCSIDVEFFPYDIQICRLKFGSLTYDASQVEIRHILQRQVPELNGSVEIDFAVDLYDFQPSVEFDLISAPVKTFQRPNHTHSEIQVNLRLKRKVFFFTLNLMLPCVAISFLTVLVFYLPSDSREKISLSISILLSLILFILLVAEIMPSTSLVVPLIGKYLLFTLVLVTLSIIFAVIILNIHFRSGETHRMSTWTRRIFLELLPRFLGFSLKEHKNKFEKERIKKDLKAFCLQSCKKLKRSNKNNKQYTTKSQKVENGIMHQKMCLSPTLESNIFSLKIKNQLVTKTSFSESNLSEHEILSSYINNAEVLDNIVYYDDGHSELRSNNKTKNSLKLSSTSSQEDLELPKLKPELISQVSKAVGGLDYIAVHLKDENFQTSIQEDWKLVAMLLDRLLLCLFLFACILSCTSIILRAPTLYDAGIALTPENFPNLVNLTFIDINERVAIQLPIKQDG